jgi:Lysyl-tRNA synthetase (class I)
MHGIDVIANILMEKNKVNRIASGTSISGMIHIGNLTDVIIAEALNRSILEKERKVLWCG